MDYSHIRSKVDSGVAKPAARPPKKDERYYVGVWKQGSGGIDTEISKLRAKLLEVISMNTVNRLVFI